MPAVMENGIIYMARCLTNGKRYIGQTQYTLAHRRKEHIYNAFHSTRKNHFHNAICKYGEDSFIWLVLGYERDERKRLQIETDYIAQYDTFNNGYNSRREGTAPHFTPETRHKISEANKGKTRTAETRHRMSEANKGKTHTAEARRRMSEAKKGMTLETKRKISEANKGRILTAETRRRMSEAAKRRWQSTTYMQK